MGVIIALYNAMSAKTYKVVDYFLSDAAIITIKIKQPYYK
ncbi:hypothetical protein CPS_3911 [Colwellia psychrerythraea 34H]|uniref:Uncharacterized protein n=1 Tax=Colwellia psychrerythraea (strain 34H / ATCC BAA-681) TaxID=167879 RepID=Q47XA1_COLP3|nr:hypothetical protein CPS_3911 [Colwellia psychrerythraea 34H]